MRKLFDHYRPERHYMRGPGPKWLEKHGRTGRTGPVANDRVVIKAVAQRLVKRPPRRGPFRSRVDTGCGFLPAAFANTRLEHSPISLMGADRNTRLKTIIVSTLAAISMVCVGIAGRAFDAKDRAGQVREHDPREAGSQQ